MGSLIILYTASSEPVFIKSSAGYVHSFIGSEKDHTAILCKLDDLGRGDLTSDENNAFHIHHFGGSYDLKVDKTREEHCLFFDISQDVTHHITAASRVDLILKLILSAEDFGIEKLNDFAYFHMFFITSRRRGGISLNDLNSFSDFVYTFNYTTN